MTSIQNTNTLPYFVKTVLEKVNDETKEALPIMQLPIHGDKPQILPYPLPSKVLPDGIFGKKEPAEIKLPELPLKQELDPEKEKEIADAFKATDKDGDLKVNKQEIVDKIIAEYKETGKFPEGYDNIGDYIADQMEKFEKYDQNKDGKLNIDEYTNMATAPKLDLSDFDIEKIKQKLEQYKPNYDYRLY